MVILLAIPVTVLALQHEQNLQQHAASSSVTLQMYNGHVLAMPAVFFRKTASYASTATSMAYVGNLATNKTVSYTTAVLLQSRVQAMNNLPGYVEYSQYLPPTGGQSKDTSCVGWAVDYGLRGWYAKKNGYYPGDDTLGNGSFSPMYTFSLMAQKNGGKPGVSDEVSFDDLIKFWNQDSSVDSRVDFRGGDVIKGDHALLPPPSAAEEANARKYKINLSNTTELPTNSWGAFWNGHWNELGQNVTQMEIENSLAHGRAVVIVLQVNSNEWLTNAPYVTKPSSYDSNHAVLVWGYRDCQGHASRSGCLTSTSSTKEFPVADGVYIQDSYYGTGKNGERILSWDYVNAAVNGILTIDPITPTVSQISKKSFQIPTAPPNSCTQIGGRCVNVEDGRNRNKGMCPSLDGQLYTEIATPDNSCDKVLPGTVCCVPKNQTQSQANASSLSTVNSQSSSPLQSIIKILQNANTPQVQMTQGTNQTQKSACETSGGTCVSWNQRSCQLNCNTSPANACTQNGCATGQRCCY